MVKNCVRLSTQKNGSSQSEWGEDRHRQTSERFHRLWLRGFLSVIWTLGKTTAQKGAVPMTGCADTECRSTQVAPGDTDCELPWSCWLCHLLSTPRGATATGHGVWAEPCAVRTKGPAGGAARCWEKCSQKQASGEASLWDQIPRPLAHQEVWVCRQSLEREDNFNHG